jgi:hypothetical protein
MRYVIAASTEWLVRQCREVLEEILDVDFQVGSVAETGADCDAAILSFPLAHERYGGVPRMGVAQVLVNERTDGAPSIILATPPGVAKTSAAGVNASEVQEYVVNVLDSCREAFLTVFPGEDDSRILIHLEAAGIDRRDMGPTLDGLVRFLSGHGHSASSST